MRTAMERMELYILVMVVLLASVVAGSAVAMTVYALSKACRDPYRFPTPNFSPVRSMRDSAMTTLETRHGPFVKVATNPCEPCTTSAEARRL
uniref:Secreted protein n=1 Tax=Plectus sambesii TaxID=2011161 RepID=A0A914VQ38_9BILA